MAKALRIHCLCGGENILANGGVKLKEPVVIYLIGSPLSPSSLRYVKLRLRANINKEANSLAIKKEKKTKKTKKMVKMEM